MLRESGHIPDQESRTPLKNKEAIGYMDLKVSGDKESEVEDDNTEPDKGDTVGAIEEGKVVEALEERDPVKAPEKECDQAAYCSFWDEMYYFSKNK